MVATPAASASQSGADKNPAPNTRKSSRNKPWKAQSQPAVNAGASTSKAAAASSSQPSAKQDLSPKKNQPAKKHTVAVKVANDAPEINDTAVVQQAAQRREDAIPARAQADDNGGQHGFRHMPGPGAAKNIDIAHRSRPIYIYPGRQYFYPPSCVFCGAGQHAHKIFKCPKWNQGLDTREAWNRLNMRCSYLPTCKICGATDHHKADSCKEKAELCDCGSDIKHNRKLHFDKIVTHPATYRKGKKRNNNEVEDASEDEDDA